MSANAAGRTKRGRPNYGLVVSPSPSSPVFPHDPNGPAATFAAAVIRLASTGEHELAEVLLKAHHVAMRSDTSDPSRYYELHLTLHDEELRLAVEKREAVEEALAIASAFSWKLVATPVPPELAELRRRLNTELANRGLPAVTDVRFRSRPGGGTHNVAVHPSTTSWEEIREIDQVLFKIGERQTAWIQLNGADSLSPAVGRPAEVAVPDRPIVFISYSASDEEYVDELRNHLAAIRRQLANVWTFREIAAGDNHHQAIKEHLEQAAFGILMISAKFLASDYVADVELPQLTKGPGRLFAVIVGHCDHTDITRDLYAPWGLKPLSEMTVPERDRIYTQVAVALRQAVGTQP
jgi:hypothetical protein